MKRERPSARSTEVSIGLTNRRGALRKLVWGAPAVVATAALNARAANGSCGPDDEPPVPCGPDG